jgi:hypothetical protein
MEESKKAELATQALREAIQEAHGLLKDLKQTKRTIEMLIAGVEEKLEEEVRTQVAGLEDATNKAIQKSTAAVFARFDQLAAILMGETDKDKKAGKESIPDLVEQFAESRKGRQCNTSSQA